MLITTMTNISTINKNYNTLNLQNLYKNSSQIKSRIYTKQRIFIMLNKKKSLINNLNNNINKIINYKSYLFHHNNSNLIIQNRIKELNNKVNFIIILLNKIEWEENLILSTLPKNKNNFTFSFFKCFQ